MAISKVSFGDKPLIDLTGDTIEPNVVLDGYTFHGANGELQTGNLVPSEVGGDRVWTLYAGNYFLKELNYINTNNYKLVYKLNASQLVVDNQTLYNIIKDNKITICDQIFQTYPLIYSNYSNNNILQDDNDILCNVWRQIHLIEGVKSCDLAYGWPKLVGNGGDNFSNRFVRYLDNTNIIEFANSVESCYAYFAGQNLYGSASSGYKNLISGYRFDIYLNKNLKDASYLFFNAYSSCSNACLNSIVIGENLQYMTKAFSSFNVDLNEVSFILENNAKNLISIAGLFYESGSLLSERSMSNLYKFIVEANIEDISTLFGSSTILSVYRFHRNIGVESFYDNYIEIPYGVKYCSYMFHCKSIRDPSTLTNIYIASTVKSASGMFYLSHGYLGNNINNNGVNIIFNGQGNISCCYMFNSAAWNIKSITNLPVCYENSDCSYMFNNFGYDYKSNHKLNLGFSFFGNNNVNAYYMFNSCQPSLTINRLGNLTIRGSNSTYVGAFSNAFNNLNYLNNINVNVGNNTYYYRMFDGESGLITGLNIRIRLYPDLIDSYIPYFYSFINSNSTAQHSSCNIYIYNTSKKQINLAGFFFIYNKKWKIGLNIFCNNLNNLIGISNLFNNQALLSFTTSITNGVRNASYNVNIYTNLTS